MPATRGPLAARLDHTGIVVPDLEQAVDFFTQNFGATIAFRMKQFIDESGSAVARLGARKGASFGLVMLSMGAGRLELLQWWPCLDSENASMTPAPNVRGAVHIAIEVAEVQATINRLRLAPGVQVLSDALTFDEGPTPGLTNAFFHTPWGQLIELVSWPRP